MINHENIQPNRFAPEYELPQDQFAVEMQLRDSFTAHFPNDAPLLNSALTELQREAGINNTAQYVVDRTELQQEKASQLVDDIFHSPLKPDGFKTLAVKMPLNVTQDVYDVADKETQEVYHVERSGVVAIDMPAVTHELVSALYSLTGAKVERDDRQAGLIRGQVIRSAKYMGANIFFEEGYDDNWSNTGKTSFTLRLLGHQLAADSVVELNSAQQRWFTEQSGVDPFEVRGIIRDNDVNVYNYQAIAGVLRSANAIIEDAADTPPKPSNPA